MKAEAGSYGITHIKQPKVSNYKHACSLRPLLKKKTQYRIWEDTRWTLKWKTKTSSVILALPQGPGSGVQVMTDNFLLCCFYCWLIDVTVVAERTEWNCAKQRQRRLIPDSGQPRSSNPTNYTSLMAECQPGGCSLVGACQLGALCQ